jgi:hypothetical protein
MKKNTSSIINKIRKRIKRTAPGTLFKGDDVLFKNILSDAKVYGEYGCGASTDWVLANTQAYVMATDTSKQWLDFVANKLTPQQRERFSYNHADLGELKSWGRPIGYEKRKNFSVYTDWLWHQDRKPDTVLVDGRFRVCCFLTILKFADVGTKIIFDDYTDRPQYHLIEEYLKREDEFGRQAIFTVPEKSKLDLVKIDQEIINFRHVMD